MSSRASGTRAPCSGSTLRRCPGPAPCASVPPGTDHCRLRTATGKVSAESPELTGDLSEAPLSLAADQVWVATGDELVALAADSLEVTERLTLPSAAQVTGDTRSEYVSTPGRVLRVGRLTAM